MPNSVTPKFILAFDTAMAACAVAILNTETDKALSETRMMARGQSESLVPMVQDILARAGLGFQEIGLIATTIGPGAFTGLRIGLSTARSFGLALGIPVAGVRTTDALIESAKLKTFDNSPLLAVLETKREDYYVQEEGSDPVILSGDHLLMQYQNRALSLCGDGVFRLREEFALKWSSGWRIVPDCVQCDPVIIARIAMSDYKEGQMRRPDPLYLRDADVSQSNRPPRIISE